MEPLHGALARSFRINKEGVKLAIPRSSRDYTIELSGDAGAYDFSNWGVQYKVGVAPLGLACPHYWRADTVRGCLITL